MLNEGKGSVLLPDSAFTALKTTPNGGSYGLGVAIGRYKDDLFFNHGGSGYGFLTYRALDGVPLLEQEPGLFFTKTGEAVDFRGETPTWRNIRVTKR